MAAGNVVYSSRHPNGRSRAYIFSVYVIRPLATCMLPVMIGALISMLEGLPALNYLYFGFPTAVLISAVWTSIFTQKHIAEVHFMQDAVAIRSVWSAALPAASLKWYRVLDIQTSGSKAHITIGYELFTLHQREWIDFDSLLAKLQELNVPPVMPTEA